MQKIKIIMALAICFFSSFSLLLARDTQTNANDVHVNGYYRKDWTYVKPHYRSAPDSAVLNNYGCIDNNDCTIRANNTYGLYGNYQPSASARDNLNLISQYTPPKIKFDKYYIFLISKINISLLDQKPKIYSPEYIWWNYSFIEISQCKSSNGYHVIPVSITYPVNIKGLLCEKTKKNWNNYRVYSNAGGGNLRKNPFIWDNIVNFIKNNEIVHSIDEKILNGEVWVFVLTKNKWQWWMHKPLLNEYQ